MGGYSSSCELTEGVHGPCPSYDGTPAAHACLESPPCGRRRGRRSLDGDPPGGRGLGGRGRRPPAGRALPARLLAGIWLGGLGIYSLVLSAALPGLGVRRSLLLNLSGSAVANVLPLGGAVATALNWRMVRPGDPGRLLRRLHPAHQRPRRAHQAAAAAGGGRDPGHPERARSGGAVVDERLVRGGGLVAGAVRAVLRAIAPSGGRRAARGPRGSWRGSRSRPSGSRACSPASGTGCCRPASAYVAAQVTLLYFASGRSGSRARWSWC